MVVEGSPKLTYKWFKDGSPIIGATKNKIGLKKVTTEKDNGVYKVEITNPVESLPVQSITLQLLVG